ncbi:hypothetical protein GC175_01105 [bacterium]|nr:hypothetical protein [bacterium]
MKGMNELTRFYFGHHKCASQYVKTILRQSGILMGWSVKVDGIASQLPMDYHLNEPFLSRIGAKQELLAHGAYDLICLENADNDALAIIEAHRNYRGFHVIRDPRDIVVSGYFSHLYSHPVSEHESPWLWAYREHLNSLPDQESGLLAEIEFCSTYFARLRDWNYENPNILEVRYERLIADPLETFVQVFRFLGVSIPPFAPLRLAQAGGNLALYALRKFTRRSSDLSLVLKSEALPKQALRRLLQRHSFERKSGGRNRGAENVKHHYRKGVAGDWSNYFTPCVKDAFKHHYPDLLTRLGYEQDDLW